MRLIVDDHPRDPLLEVALGPALLRHAIASGEGPALRVYRPLPTLAFSGRDCNSPGIIRAAQAARTHGFQPVRRGPGGRAAAYHRESICLDHVSAEPLGHTPITTRFTEFGLLIANALKTLGVTAQLGPVPGEYCPGEHSVNDGRGHKIVGTAQRLTTGGWLFSTSIIVGDPEPIRQVLTDVYRHLDLDWDPATVGALTDTDPTLTVGAVVTALLEGYAALGDWTPTPLPDDVQQLAESSIDRHQVR